MVMTVTVKRVEKELNVPRDLLLRDGMKRYLEFELRRLEIDATKIRRRHGVKSFDDLWSKLESGKVSEAECFDDLTRLEYLEARSEKVVKLLEEL
jgi:3-methyladenine DNA glycosylase AlkD